MDPTNRRDDAAKRRWAPFALALLVHALVLAAVAIAPPSNDRRPSLQTEDPRDVIESAIEVAITGEENALDTAPASEPIAMATAPKTNASAHPSAATGSTAKPELDQPQPVESSSNTSAEVVQIDSTAPPVGTESAPVPSVGSPLAPVDLGIAGGGRANPFMPKSEAAVEAAETKRIAKRILHDAARDRERALGLGPEGPVLTALAEGTRASVAPVRGRAVFVATSNEAGEVVSLELADAEGTGGRPGWADAGRIALAALKGKKLRIPVGTTRGVMRIEVVSAVKLPSGHDPGADVTLLGVPVSKGEGKDATKVQILTPKMSAVPFEMLPNVKLAIPTLEFTIFGTDFDVVNIGARASRIVHTRLLDSSMM